MINFYTINKHTLPFKGVDAKAEKPVKTITYISKNGKQVSTYNYRLPVDIDKAREKVCGKTPEEILYLSGIYEVPEDEWETVLPVNIKTNREDKILSEYCSPRTTYGFSDIGIDEESLLEGVIGTTGSFNLRNSALKSSGSVQYIGGDLVIGPESKIEDLSSIKLVRGSAIVECDSQKEAENILDRLNFDTEALDGKIFYIPPAKIGRTLNIEA